MANSVVPSGETSSGLTITRTSVTVLNGGLALDTRINSAGKLIVSSGGEARDTVINANGKMAVNYQGLADGIVVSKGANLTIASDGSALAIKEEGGYVTWSSGAVVTFVPSVFTNYSYKQDTVAIHSGTTANSTTLNYSVDFLVYNGGLASETRINSAGSLHIYSGGEARDTIINSAGRMYVNYQGLADGIVVSKGANLTIASDGSALAIKEEGGYVTWSSGAVVTFVPSVFTNYSYKQDTVAIHSGTTANSTTLNYSVDFLVYNGGLASETRINSAGSLHIYSGGEARDTIINSAGRMYVNYQGLADGIVVSSGARLTVASDGKLTGQVEIINGATVSASAGAIIDFDISMLEPGNAVRVSNLSLVKGAPVYTLTVSGTQAYGVYSLAGGAAGFNKTITVQNPLGKKVGTLTVENPLVTYDTAYVAAIGVPADGSVLSLTVALNEAPTVTDIKADITVPTYQAITVTAVFSDDYGVASALYKIGDSGAWTAYVDGVTVKKNSTVYFKAIDIGGKESSVVGYEVTNIEEAPPDTVAPTVTNVKANVTDSITQPVTVTAVFSDDVELASSLYRIGETGTWKVYTTGVTVSQNATIYFKAVDAAGNESEIVSYDVTNIKAPVQLPDLGFYWPEEWCSRVVIAPDTDQETAQTLPDYYQLYLSYSVDNDGAVASQPFRVETYIDGDYYRTEEFQGIRSGYYRQLDYQEIGSFAAGEHTVTLKIVSDEEDAVPEDNIYTRTFTVTDTGRGSYEDNAYGYISKTLYAHETLTLDYGKYVFGGNFIGYTTGKKLNAKIEVFNSNGKKVGTVSVKKGKVAYKEFVLAKDSYYIKVSGTDKSKTEEKFLLSVTGDVFYKSDLYDNSISDVKNQYPYLVTVRDEARSLISNGWVGFGDVLSFRQVDFEYSGKYTFTVKSSDQVKVSLISVTTDAKGRSKEKTVASMSISGKKIGKDNNFGGVLLTSGSYYLRVEALKAAKGTNADYSVRINGNSTFFTDGDDGWNNYLYDKKAAHPLNPNADDFITTEITSDTNEILLDEELRRLRRRHRLCEDRPERGCKAQLQPYRHGCHEVHRL